MKLYDLELFKGCRIVANKEDGGFAIADLKPVDAVPVVHGHWIVRTVWHGGIGDIYSKCSVCGFETRGEPHTRGDRRGSNYCEDCGAKMDEEEENAAD